MRTTITIDDQLLEDARRLSGIEERAALIRAALTALIERESARRLVAMAGTEKQLKPVPRRRNA